MQNQAEELLSLWIEHVNNRDLEGVLSMYAESAVLLPTFSSEIRTNHEGIRRYFEKLADYDEVKVVLDQGSTVVHQMSDNICSIGGLYLWHFVEGQDRSSCMARFTFNFDLLSERPILHHHSSVVPVD